MLLIIGVVWGNFFCIFYENDLCSFLFIFLSAFIIFTKYFVCLPGFQIYWNTCDPNSFCLHILFLT